MGLRATPLIVGGALALFGAMEAKKNLGMARSFYALTERDRTELVSINSKEDEKVRKAKYELTVAENELSNFSKKDLVLILAEDNSESLRLKTVLKSNVNNYLLAKSNYTSVLTNSTNLTKVRKEIENIDKERSYVIGDIADRIILGLCFTLMGTTIGGFEFFRYSFLERKDKRREYD